MIATSIDKHQYIVLDAMRFPLIVLVLYMHIVPIEHFPVTADFTSINLYRFISELVAHNIGRAAVPCFFIISGFFYFRKMETWTSTFYINQQRKRIRTLLIPYLLWNILNILIILAKGYSFNLMGRDGSADLNYIYQSSLWSLMTYPVNQPLWYLRDLICMTIIAPIFYDLFRFAKHWGILLLFAIYLSTFELPILGFSMTAIFYFGIGAYWGLNHVNFVDDLKFLRIPSYILAPVLAIVAVGMNYSPFYEYIIRLYIPFGIIAILNLTSDLIKVEKIKNMLVKLSGSVFFIYSVHELYLKSWVKGAFFKTPLAGNGWGMILGYLVMPIVLLGICMLLYYFAKKITPKTLSLFTGGRI